MGWTMPGGEHLPSGGPRVDEEAAGQGGGSRLAQAQKPAQDK
jgi:hypothetical protein